MKILIVEDDCKIASFISKGLAQAGFTVDLRESAEEGLALAENSFYDLLIVDIMLPGMDGIELIESLRGKGYNMPILILSARQSVNDKVRGLRHGGDDYLTKPFSFAELLARVQALIRRTSRLSENSSKLAVGDLTLDLYSHTVERAGKKIELRPREFTLLEYLMRNAGNVLTKTMIMEKVWNYDFDPQTNIVDVLISRLRNKIDNNYKVKLIKTIRGVGYVLKVD
ncbi:MAG: DNA-binding response regulator [Spirochaetes bacterium]|nr:MAG: DNA-binding response regulator [Spirochaetota bacterium]